VIERVNQPPGAAVRDPPWSFAVRTVRDAAGVEPELEAVDIDGVRRARGPGLETQGGGGLEIDVGENGAEVVADAEVFLGLRGRGHHGELSCASFSHKMIRLRGDREKECVFLCEGEPVVLSTLLRTKLVR